MNITLILLGDNRSVNHFCVDQKPKMAAMWDYFNYHLLLWNYIEQLYRRLGRNIHCYCTKFMVFSL